MSPSPTRAAPVPFWNRLRDIVLYPVRGAALALLVGLTLVSLLGALPGIGFIITLLVWVTAYKFGFEILRSTADGRMEAPETALSVDNSVIWSFIGLQFVLFFVVAMAFGVGGPLVGVIALVLVVLMQPGCIMSLAIDGSFAHAIDPTTSLAIIKRVGGPYFAVFGLLFVIQASAATAGNWLAQLMPPLLGDLALTLFSFWGLFAAFHLMGYLVYQYHEVLGYEPESLRQDRPLRGDRDRDLLEQAEAMVRDGRTDAATTLLRADIQSRAVSLEVHELYRRVLRSGPDRAAADAHAATYLNLLVLEKQERRALGLLREALDADPDFVPMQVEHGDMLAERARGAGQAKLALDQWQALLRRLPEHAAAPRWALAAALLLVDRFGRDADARNLLQQARARCTDAALIDKIDAALKPLGATPA